MRTLPWFVGFFMFLIVAAGLTWGYIEFTTQEVQDKISETTLFSPAATAAPLDRIDWETYINKEFGYSVKYPQGWKKTEWDITDAAHLTSVPNGSIWHQSIFEGPDGRFEVVVWENSGGASVRNWISWFRHEDLKLKNVPTEPNITLANGEAISYIQFETARKKPLHYVFTGAGSRIYEVIFERPDVTNENVTVETLSKSDVHEYILQSFVMLPQ